VEASHETHIILQMVFDGLISNISYGMLVQVQLSKRHWRTLVVHIIYHHRYFYVDTRVYARRSSSIKDNMPAIPIYQNKMAEIIVPRSTCNLTLFQSTNIKHARSLT
jgi:hypothetical protein